MPRLREGAGQAVSELLNDVAKEEWQRFSELVEKIRDYDEELMFDLDEAHAAVTAAIQEAAFIAGFEAGRDPSRLIFEPAEEATDGRQ